MIAPKVLELFHSYDERIKLLIAEVIKIEQENIHLQRPRIKDQIRAVVDEVVKHEEAEQ
jgi:hypothetical protein